MLVVNVTGTVDNQWHVIFYIIVDPLLLELTVSDLAKRVEATESHLAQALRWISALEERLAKEQPLHHVQDTVRTTITGASVYPPTLSRTTVPLPKPSCITVLPTSTQATDLPPATSYSPATSTPVLASTHQVDISLPDPTCVEQLNCSPFPSSNSPLGIGDGYFLYEPSNYPADFYTSSTQGNWFFLKLVFLKVFRVFLLFLQATPHLHSLPVLPYLILQLSHPTHCLQGLLQVIFHTPHLHRLRSACLFLPNRTAYHLLSLTRKSLFLWPSALTDTLSCKLRARPLFSL